MMPLIKNTTATLRYVFSFHTLVGLTVMVVLSVLLSTNSFAQARKVTDPQLKERKLRELNANEQLKRYYQRMKSDLLKEKPGLNGVPVTSKVQIKLNAASQTSSVIFFYDDMEGGTNGWTTELIGGSTDNLWHQTTRDAGSPTHSWWCGIEIQGDYHTGNRINTALKSPAINLTTAVAPVKMLFTENFVTEQGWDFCMIEVSTDGGTTWTQLRGGYGSAPNGDSDGWDISTLDLSTYAGSTINLRFHFDTGDTLFNNFPGWYIDDVVIFDQGGQITGKTFFDVNHDGVKDVGERGIRDWLVTGDGPISLTARTNHRGRYWLTLPLGTYNVTETVKPAWTQTFPDTNDYDVTLSTADTVVDSVHFGNWRQASFISGYKFNDFDHDGVFNGVDTGIVNWKIILYDTLGNEVDFDRTDSLTGFYTLYVFEANQYLVAEEDKHSWVQTAPDSGKYRVTIPDLVTTVTNKNFGNYYSDSVNSILGTKFNDLNHNGVKDDHEPGLAGWIIHLTAPGVGNKYRTTDSSGNYKFLSLPKFRTYTVEEIHQAGWCQSMPESSYTLPLTQGDFFDSVDFGNYEVPAGSIAGTKFNDLNGNGARDSGEVGLAGFTINLYGLVNGTSINLQTTSDTSGAYSFSGLWAGKYTLSELFRQGWVQTYPANFGTHYIVLGCEDNRTGVDFGNIDSVFLYSFRTFTAESLALGKDKKGKVKPVLPIPDKVEFCAKFKNEEADSVGKLLIRFEVGTVVGTLSSSKPGTINDPDGKGKFIQIVFDSFVQPGDSVVVCGFGKKAKLQHVNKWWWKFAGDLNSAKKITSDLTLNELRLPMPNTINAIQAVGNALRIGLGGPHSVVHASWKDVIKSLVEKGDRMHLGDPRCLDRTTNHRLISKERKYLTPTQGQNKLYAKAIALKVNLLASQAGVTPSGLGGLIYDDGTSNPLNGRSLISIAAGVDSFMSQETCTMLPSMSGMNVLQLDTLLGKINEAFSGPLDTTSFGSGLKFSPVKELVDVPFLHFSPVNDPMSRLIGTPGPEMPEVFTLYQNYPNPFNPTTTIEFDLPLHSFVTMKIYNNLGQEVVVLFDHEEMEDGSHHIDLSTAKYNLASGVYYYRLVAESIADEDGISRQTFTSVRKMLLVK